MFQIDCIGHVVQCFVDESWDDSSVGGVVFPRSIDIEGPDSN